MQAQQHATPIRWRFLKIGDSRPLATDIRTRR